MILWISKFIAGLFGFQDITLIQKRVILGLIVVVVVVVVGLGMSLRSCFHREPKLDEKAIQKVQNAIATQDHEAMTQVLTEIEVKEKRIDANANDAQAQTFTAIQNAKEKAAAMTNEQIAAELERKLHE